MLSQMGPVRPSWQMWRRVRAVGQSPTAMRILITGGGGFIGQKVARTLLVRGGIADEPDARPKLTELVLFDQSFPPNRVVDARVQCVTGDMLDDNLLARACAP